MTSIPRRGYGAHARQGAMEGGLTLGAAKKEHAHTFPLTRRDKRSAPLAAWLDLGGGRGVAPAGQGSDQVAA